MRIPGYQIERQIGQGGMASIYLATQDTFQRQVALKVITPALASDSDFTRRFLREGELAAKLQHPNIIKIFDTGVSGSNYYLAMEYFPHGTLRERIQEGLSLADALAMVKRIASALDYAHRQGIVHRDIKSQNILLYEDGTPVVSDFGIAKALDASTVLTSINAVVGSPNYMSPEQIEGKPVDARSDRYSLGILFYEMLIKQLPFSAEGFVAIAYKHMNETVPDLPVELAAFQPVVNKLLAKQPDARYQTEQQFIDALAVAEAHSVSLITDANSANTQPRYHTNKAYAASTRTGLMGGAAAMIALLLGGGFYVYPELQIQTEAEPSPLAEQQPQQPETKNQQEQPEEALTHAKRNPVAPVTNNFEKTLAVVPKPELNEKLFAPEAVKRPLNETEQKRPKELGEILAVAPKPELNEKPFAPEAVKRPLGEAEQKRQVETQPPKGEKQPTVDSTPPFEAKQFEVKNETEQQEKPFERLLAQATEAQNRGHFEAALRFIKDARTLTPSSTEVLNLEKQIHTQLAATEQRLTSQKRREIQQALTLIGFDTEGVDGVFGGNTRKAIVGFQKKYDHLATGYLTARQIASLMSYAEQPLKEWKAAEARRKREKQTKSTSRSSQSSQKPTVKRKPEKPTTSQSSQSRQKPALASGQVECRGPRGAVITSKEVCLRVGGTVVRE